VSVFGSSSEFFAAFLLHSVAFVEHFIQAFSIMYCDILWPFVVSGIALLPRTLNVVVFLLSNSLFFVSQLFLIIVISFADYFRLRSNVSYFSL